MGRGEWDFARLADGVAGGDRVALARAITLVESRRPQDRPAAEGLLERLLERTGKALRVGISGVPGVGKSTLIETLGIQLLEAGEQVAVLAVDPSSSQTGGSILGDKARMHRLAQAQGAFIRPSPASDTLGGVARRTKEVLLLCEAAGFSTVLVETVGVGQSETEVRNLVDSFVLLLLPNAGDELQGIKRGIVELADVIAINKCDGPGRDAAKVAEAQLRGALGYGRRRAGDWQVPTHLVSGLTGEGLDGLWKSVLAHRARLESCGELRAARARQELVWLRSELECQWLERLGPLWETSPLRPTLEGRVAAREWSAPRAARAFLESIAPNPDGPTPKEQTP